MDLKVIEELIKMMETSKLSSLEIEVNNMKIKMEKNYNQAELETDSAISAVNITHNKIEEEAVKEKLDNSYLENNLENTFVIKSPMVGTFYASASPSGEAFVKVGDFIHKGDTVCIVEAMKLMNEIESEADGAIVEVLVKDGQMVEYGTELFRVKK